MSLMHEIWDNINTHLGGGIIDVLTRTTRSQVRRNRRDALRGLGRAGVFLEAGMSIHLLLPYRVDQVLL